MTKHCGCMTPRRLSVTEGLGSTLEARFFHSVATSIVRVASEQIRVSLGDMPVSSDLIQRAIVDAEELARAVRANPAVALAIAEAVREGRAQAARKLLSSIGLDEATLESKGGGLWGLVLVAVICLMIPGDDIQREQPVVRTTQEVKDNLQEMGIIR